MGRGSEIQRNQPTVTEDYPSSILPFWAWLVLIAVVLLLATWLHSQEPKHNPADPPPAPATKAEAPKPIKVKAESALRIRDAQVQLLDLNAKMVQMQNEMREKQEALNAAVQAAYKDAGLKQEEWDIDPADWLWKPKKKP